ncbi:MAG: insulinase family protein [Bacteroidales bacterium]|jgi:zinc protease|nr:insulinase family protein [Bacteroidales bacterium]
MKKLFAILVVLCAALISAAQPLPQDPKLRTGVLPNGMTYYIRFNNQPPNRADFYIAQRVGSILEEENQRGLAHFLEHMAFNGTVHFPGTSLRDFLEKNGIKFGENLNAYTSIDETVYNIKNVPSRRGLMDSVLLVLHDWSNFLTLDSVEIDKERGVIHEEWRTRTGATARMYEQILPEIYGSDRYGHRLPIGLMSVIDNFQYQELRDYYHRWYRPDLQGIIIVGDFDIDSMEVRVKQLFSTIPAAQNPAERVYLPVTPNVQPIVSIASDKEATSSQIMIFNKFDAFPESEKNTYEYMNFLFSKILIESMMNARYAEILQKPDAPFVRVGVEVGDFFFSKTQGALTTYAHSKDGKIDQSIQRMVHETQRVRQFGFTQTEFERAKADFLNAMESAYNERNNERNERYVQEYIRLFLDNEPAPGIEFEFAFYSQRAQTLLLAEVNTLARTFITDSVVIVLMLPQKHNVDIPSKEHILQVFQTAKTDAITPYVDAVVDTQLIQKLPKPGTVVQSKTSLEMGTTRWILSNGITVIFKQTDFKADQILMQASSKGGESLLSEKDIATILVLNDVINISGVGNLSKNDLEKALAGKNVNVQPRVSLRHEAIAGACSPRDLETMLQLTYLYFTKPRADKQAFEAYMSRKQSDLQNAERNPMTTFSDSINAILFNNHPRKQRMRTALLPKVDFAAAQKMYKQRFMNNDHFTFIFVGAITPDSVETLITQYIGALPKTKEKESFADVGIRQPQGVKATAFGKRMETAKTTAFVYYTGTCDYTLKNIILMDMFSQIMRIVYTEKVREDEGGTYGVSVNGAVSKFPEPYATLQIMFDTNAEVVQKLLAIIYKELQAVQDNGVRPEDFTKVKEFMLKRINELRTENPYWLRVLDEKNNTGLDSNTGYEHLLKEITMSDVQEFAKQLLQQGNKREIVMNGETVTEGNSAQ